MLQTNRGIEFEDSTKIKKDQKSEENFLYFHLTDKVKNSVHSFILC